MGTQPHTVTRYSNMLHTVVSTQDCAQDSAPDYGAATSAVTLQQDPTGMKSWASDKNSAEHKVGSTEHKVG